MEKTPAQETEQKKHLKFLKDRLMRFLSKDKPADVLIIKAHLLCEYYLNQVLLLRELCSAEELNKLSFYDKAAKALDPKDEWERDLLQSLKLLNRLRNKVGHELEYSLSESDVDSLGFVQGKEYIVNKYDFENLTDLLRDSLMNIVVDVSLVVFDLVVTHKNGGKSAIPSLPGGNESQTKDRSTDQ